MHLQHSDIYHTMFYYCLTEGLPLFISVCPLPRVRCRSQKDACYSETWSSCAADPIPSVVSQYLPPDPRNRKRYAPPSRSDPIRRLVLSFAPNGNVVIRHVKKAGSVHVKNSSWHRPAPQWRGNQSRPVICCMARYDTIRYDTVD